MNRKSTIVFVCALMIFLCVLVLCLPVAFAYFFDDHPPEPTVLPALSIDWTAQYSDVLSQYKRIVEDNFYLHEKEIPYDSFGEDVNLLIIENLRGLFLPNSFEYNIYYALYDINNDGIFELIIGAGNDDNIIQFDIFTIKYETVTNIFQNIYNFSFGGNSTFTIHTESIIAVNMHESTECNILEFFRFSPDGNVVFLEGLIADVEYNEAARSRVERYGKSSGNKAGETRKKYTRISREEYDNIIRKYIQGDYIENEVSLEWILIK